MMNATPWHKFFLTRRQVSKQRLISRLHEGSLKKIDCLNGLKVTYNDSVGKKTTNARNRTGGQGMRIPDVDHYTTLVVVYLMKRIGLILLQKELAVACCGSSSLFAVTRSMGTTPVVRLPDVSPGDGAHPWIPG